LYKKFSKTFMKKSNFDFFKLLHIPPLEKYCDFLHEHTKAVHISPNDCSQSLFE
jgi:hypothetical protein